MTKAQRNKVEILRKLTEREFRFDLGKYEFKKFEVEETDYGKVSLYFVVGLKGDEGTLASIWCRYTGHFFIGPRGGVVYYDDKVVKRNYKNVMSISRCLGNY